MGTDVIHSVANASDVPSAATHVYLGDLPEQSRSIWNPTTLREHPFDGDSYARWAGPTADGPPTH